jgi:organic hydroperoxide reductase OsmC/OhrA
VPPLLEPRAFDGPRFPSNGVRQKTESSHLARAWACDFKEEVIMPMQDSYLYQLDVEWTGGSSGRLTAEGLPVVTFSAPLEFRGEPGQWTPEQLLVAATAGCLMTTFMAIAKIQKLNVHSYRSKAFGRLEKVPGEGYRFTEIALTPEIGVAPEGVGIALKVMAKAEQNCLVSKSLRAAVKVEPRFVSAPVEVSG